MPLCMYTLCTFSCIPIFTFSVTHDTTYIRVPSLNHSTNQYIEIFWIRFPPKILQTGSGCEQHTYFFTFHASQILCNFTWRNYRVIGTESRRAHVIYSEVSHFWRLCPEIQLPQLYQHLPPFATLPNPIKAPPPCPPICFGKKKVIINVSNGSSPPTFYTTTFKS